MYVSILQKQNCINILLGILFKFWKTKSDKTELFTKEND